MANKKFQKQYLLSKEQLIKNLDIFSNTNEKYKIFTDELLDYLTNNGLFDCPASTSLNLHNCFPGGLIDHIIRVGRFSTKINELLSNTLKQEVESIIKVVFLHSIGKVGLYEEQESKWHRDNLGSYYQYATEDKVTMKIGERSAYLAMKYDIKLSDFEYQAVINSSKNLEEDLQAKYFSDPLTIILRQGISLAAIEEQQIFKDFNKE